MLCVLWVWFGVFGRCCLSFRFVGMFGVYVGLVGALCVVFGVWFVCVMLIVLVSLAEACCASVCLECVVILECCVCQVWWV